MGSVLWVFWANGTGAVVRVVLWLVGGAGTVTVRAGSGGWVTVAVGPGTVCCTVTAGAVTVVVGPGTVTVVPGVDDTAAGLLFAPIAARITMNATAPAAQPAISFTGGSAPYLPFGPRVRNPRAFSQNAQPGGAGGQDGSGCQPGGGCQFASGGVGQAGGGLKVAMVSSPSGVTSGHRDVVLHLEENEFELLGSVRRIRRRWSR